MSKDEASTSTESATQKRKSLAESDEPGPSTSGGSQSPTESPDDEYQLVPSKKRKSTETEEIKPLGKPEKLGGYSLDQSEKVYPDNKRKLRYYVGNESSERDFNLQEGYGSFVRQEPCEGLKILLEWVMNHKDESGNNIYSLQENDFVCTRGLLTKMIMFSWLSDTRREKKEKEEEPLAILVTKFKGIYFLSPAKKRWKRQTGCKDSTAPTLPKEGRRPEVPVTGKHKPDPEELIYWGWKFEQYVTAETPDGEPDPTKQVNEKESYSIVVRRRLKEHSLVFAAEVDAFDERDAKYVELKTHEGSPQSNSFRSDTYILIKWWAQSYLLDIERIVCGFWDKDGTVHTVKEFKTMDVLTMIQDRTKWRPARGLQLLDACLDKVKNTTQIKDNPNKAYLLTVSCKLSLVDSPDHMTKGILTPKFIAWMQSKG